MQKINIILRKDYKNKCGDEPLYIRTKFGTVKKNISLRIFINPKYWDNKLHQVTQEHDDFERINEKLHHVVSDLIKNNTFVLANQSILKRKNNDATISFKCENKFTFSK